MRVLPRRGAVPLWTLTSVLGLAGCAPALDWRDVQPAGSALHLQFPCKPTTQTRSVALAGAPVQLHLSACDADGQTWALAQADVGDPVRVTAALQQLRAAAAANLAPACGAMRADVLASPANAAVDDAAAAAAPAKVSGATPNQASVRLQLAGNLPDGQAVRMQLVVFTHGTRVFQATALGAQLSDAAADTFFTSLVVRP